MFLNLVFGMNSDSKKILLLRESSQQQVQSMPSENINNMEDSNHHHVQFAKKTEFIPVTIIEDHKKVHGEDEHNHKHEHELEKERINTDHNVELDIKQQVKQDCSCRHSDDSDSEQYHSRPRSILKHKPNCVVIVHQD